MSHPKWSYEWRHFFVSTSQRLREGTPAGFTKVQRGVRPGATEHPGLAQQAPVHDITAGKGRRELHRPCHAAGTAQKPGLN